MDEIFEQVFGNEFFWDVGKLDTEALWLVQGGVEVEVF
jgi:hypothetical protein